MYLKSVLWAASAAALTAGAATAETITIATVNNGDMIRMQKYTDKFTEETGHEVERRPRPSVDRTTRVRRFWLAPNKVVPLGYSPRRLAR